VCRESGAAAITTQAVFAALEGFVLPVRSPQHAMPRSGVCRTAGA